MDEKMERNRKIYAEYKAGATKASLKRKYHFSIDTINVIIRDQKWFEEAGATEWIYQMSHRTAEWLLRNEIRTQEDLYDRIGKSMPCRQVGDCTIEELNKYISREVYISESNGMSKTLSFGKKPEPVWVWELKPRKTKQIRGSFKGIIDGKAIEGELDGEYTPESHVYIKRRQDEA